MRKRLFQSLCLAGLAALAVLAGCRAQGSASTTVVPPQAGLPPLAVSDIALLQVNSANNSINVLANDVDFAGGGLQLAGASVAVSLPAATHTLWVSGNRVMFTPGANFVGALVVGYTVTDVTGASSEGVLSIVVSPLTVPTVPVPVPDTAVVAQDSGATQVNVLANDIDPAGGGLTLTGVTVTASLPSATHAVAIAGNQVQFTPAAGFAGTVLVGYTVADINGSSADGLLSITVSPLDLPVGLLAIPDSATLAQDSGPADIDVLANDIDFAGGGLTVTAVSVTSSQPSALHTVSIAGNQVRFTPAAGFAGVVVVTYTARDVNGLTSNGLLNIVVTPTALVLGPVAVPDVAAVSSLGGPVSINVLANDVDPAGGGLTLTLAVIELQVPAGAGTVSIVGNQLRYAPTALYSGAVLVRYTAADVNGRTTSGQLSLTVTP